MLQNSNWDYSQKLKLWKNLKTLIRAKLNKNSSDKIKTKVLTKLKKSSPKKNNL